VVLNFSKDSVGGEAVDRDIEDKFQIQSVVVNTDMSSNSDKDALLKTIWASAPADTVRKQRLKCTIKTGSATPPTPVQNLESSDLLHSTIDGTPKPDPVAPAPSIPSSSSSPTPTPIPTPTPAPLATTPPAIVPPTHADPSKQSGASQATKPAATPENVPPRKLVKPSVPDQHHHPSSEGVATLGPVALTQVNVVVLMVLAFLFGVILSRLF